jgi:hypothetical protein
LAGAGLVAIGCKRSLGVMSRRITRDAACGKAISKYTLICNEAWFLVVSLQTDLLDGE